MKKLTLLLTVIGFLLSACALAELMPPEKLLGQAFPDFSFTDTEGQEFVLSDLLKEKRLVVISLFATWCGPCQKEFPEMQKVMERHADEMAVLALSAYELDTMEDMAAFKAEYAPGIPFGLAAGTGILERVDIYAYPTNFFIDRFGTVAYAAAGSFPNEVTFERTARVFLGENYPETVTLSEPVKSTMAITLENGNAREADIVWRGQPTGLRFSILGDEEAVFALRAPEDMDLAASCVRNLMTDEATALSDLPLEDGAYRFACGNAKDGEALILSFEASCYGAVDTASIIVVRGEENAQVVLTPYKEAGYDVDWRYADAAGTP